MSDLAVFTYDVARTLTHVRHAAAVIAGTPAQVGAAAASVGHDHLARHVHEFAAQWSDSRDRLATVLVDLDQALIAVAETFADLDRLAARSVKAGASRC